MTILFLKGTCPAGWTNSSGGSCFKLFIDRKPFNDAEAACNNYDGNLAAFHSQQEYNTILNMTKYAFLLPAYIGR